MMLMVITHSLFIDTKFSSKNVQKRNAYVKQLKLFTTSAYELIIKMMNLFANDVCLKALEKIYDLKYELVVVVVSQKHQSKFTIFFFFNTLPFALKLSTVNYVTSYNWI